MSLVTLSPVLTSHGRLIVERDEDAPALDAELAQRIEGAFTCGSGHGLLALGGRGEAPITHPSERRNVNPSTMNTGLQISLE
jgi:hypothetical protein